MVAKQSETLFRHIKNAVATAAVVFSQALQVVIDTGDNVSQRVQSGPVRYQLPTYQLLVDITPASRNRCCRTLQRYHGKATAHTGQQGVDGRQLGVIPLIGDEGVDRFTGCLERVTRFLHH